MNRRQAAGLVISGAVVCAGGLQFWLNRGSSTPRGRVGKAVFDAESVDFGVVVPGTSVETAFRFQNAGTGTLLVSNVHTSCGCTAARLGQTQFLPGESGVIHVSFRVPSHSDPVSHSVMLETSDPRRPQVRLYVSADPEWPVAADPEAVHAVPIMKGTSVASEVELYTPSRAPFDVVAVTTSTEWITVHPTQESVWRRVYRITLSPDREGVFSESIEFRTNVGQRPIVTVPVTGEVVLPSRTVPSRLLLGTQPSGEVVERTLILSREGDVEHVAGVKLEQDGWELVAWNVDGQQDGTTAVRVRVRVPVREGYQQAELIVSCESSPDQVRVPVSCVVRSAEG